MRTTRRIVAIGAVAALLVALGAPAARSAPGPSVTTPYPAVVVGPGDTVTFDLTVSAPGRQRVDLAVEGVPKGWRAVLRGGGFVIDGVMTDPDRPPAVELEVQVPPDAPPGRYGLRVVGRAASGVDVLGIDLRVSRGAEGGVTLTTDSPRLAGPADSTFTFDLQLRNDTPRDATFDLEGAGPPGWLVDVRPVGEQLATSIRVGGGESESVQVEVDPPDDTVAGRYPVLVRAAGGGLSARAELTVEVTGNYELVFTTPDERLSADVGAGGTTTVVMVVRNTGTAPLADLRFDADPPTDWTVRFAPERIAQVAPGDSVPVRVLITPAGDAVAGDYIVRLSARNDQVSEDVDLRTTVRTSGLWGFVGIALILAALGGLWWVFQRYGRR